MPPAGTKLVTLGDERAADFLLTLIAFLSPAISPLAPTRTSLHVSNLVTEGNLFLLMGVEAAVMEELFPLWSVMLLFWDRICL